MYMYIRNMNIHLKFILILMYVVYVALLIMIKSNTHRYVAMYTAKIDNKDGRY